MPDVLSISVGGQDYGGWESVSIDYALEDLCASISLSVSDRWALENGLPTPVRRPIKAGTPVTAEIDGETVFTGYIDKPGVHRLAREHTISFDGRSKTADLEDCCIIQAGLGVQGLSLHQLAVKLCAPFGIGVVVETDTGGAFPIVNIEPGQKIFEVLDHLARLRGVLLTTDFDGNLVLTESGAETAPDKIELGVNVLASDGGADIKDRYSDYYVFTQLAQSTADAVSDAGLNLQGYAKDKLMPRYRPVVIQSEIATDTAFARKRAAWKRNVQAALSQSVTHTVRGFHHSLGLWEHNTLVTVVDPDYPLDEQRLVSKISYKKDGDGGTRTLLTTVGKDAYDRLATPDQDLLLEESGG